MKKDVWNGVALLLVAIAVLALSGCPVDSSDSTDNGTETPKDSVGLKSVTINGVAVDIGFKGTAGFAGSEGWGFNNNGAQNGGIYSAPDASALASVTVAATPQDSGASVGYAVSHYTGVNPGNAPDPEFTSPESYSPSGALGVLNDGDYIAVEVIKGETKAYYKFRVSVNAPLLGANGVSAGGTNLGWTIPDLDWTHNQGAYFHNNVGPNPDQSIGLILQDTLPVAGKTLSADAPSGATVNWAISTAGNNNTGVTQPASWNELTTALPATIASGSLLSVRVQNGSKTLYYNWWVYSKAGIKLSALSVSGNVVEASKLITFADSWSGAALQEVVIPVDGDLLEGAKITWTEPLGMGLAIAVTSGTTTPAADDWLGTSRGQNESYAIVVQPPAVDLRSGDTLSIRSKISDQVWYFRIKITFRALQASDADLTGLSVGGKPVTVFGDAAATVQAATAGQALDLTLAEATNAAIAPSGGPNAEFLFIKGDGTNTPGATAGWANSGTLSFNTGDYLIIQAFAGELDSKYYKFQVTVTYPNADDVKLNTLTIGGIPVVATDFGTPWNGAAGTKGAVEISPAQNNAPVAGAVPEAAAGSTIKYAKSAAGAEPAEADWKEAVSVPGAFPGAPPTITYPSFEFETNDELWITVAAGTQTVKTYKIVITVKTWNETDAAIDSLTILGDADFSQYPNISYGYTVNVTLGTPDAVIGSAVAGSFSVEGGKTTGFGAGLYVVAAASSGATVEFAKTTSAAPADEAWVASMGQFGPASFEFANNDTLWVRVTAGTFVKYYKFAVTVTPAAGA